MANRHKNNEKKAKKTGSFKTLAAIASAQIIFSVAGAAYTKKQIDGLKYEICRHKTLNATLQSEVENVSNVAKQKDEIISKKDELISKLENDAAFVMAYYHIDGKDYKFRVKSSDYIKYKQMRHNSTGSNDYVNYVTFNDPTVKAIADELTQGCATKEDAAAKILRFVQRHIYDKSIEDSADGKKDYVKYPLETIVERCGDCEDLSILGAALIVAVGIDAAQIYVPTKPAAHLALGVEGNFTGFNFNIGGKKYFYAETTGTSSLTSPATWKIGQLPKEYLNLKMDIYTLHKKDRSGCRFGGQSLDK